MKRIYWLSAILFGLTLFAISPLNAGVEVTPAKDGGDVVFDSVILSAGTGTGDAVVGGVLDVNTTQYSTPADTTEHDAISYTLPANTLNADDKVLRVRVFGRTAANANTKTAKLYFNGTVLNTMSGTYNAATWVLRAEIIRQGAGDQMAIPDIAVLNAISYGISGFSTPAADETTDLIIKVTAQNGTAAAADVIVEGMIVELLN